MGIGIIEINLYFLRQKGWISLGNFGFEILVLELDLF